jgi:integrase
MVLLTTFFDAYKNKSESTRESYKYAIKRYFEFVYQTSYTQNHVVDLDRLEVDIDHYFTENRDVEHDLYAYIDALKETPPTSVNIYLSALRRFFLKIDHRIPDDVWSEMQDRRPRGRRARTRDKLPTQKELRAMLDNMPLRGKALYLLLLSSGMRIGEAMKLEKDDLEFGAMNYIDVRHTKNGERRDAFCSDEAKEYLMQWLAIRSDWLKKAILRSTRAKTPTTLDDKRVFPFTTHAARRLWNLACQRVGNGKRDRETGRRMIHPHVLRKFFRTRLGGVIDLDVIESLLGHEGYLTRAYRKLTTEEKWAEYQKGMHILVIYGSATEDLSKIKTMEEVISRLSVENSSLIQRFIQLEQENIGLKGLQHQIQELQQQMQEMQATRHRSDQVMDRLFHDDEFRVLLRKKLRELKQ